MGIWNKLLQSKRVLGTVAKDTFFFSIGPNLDAREDYLQQVSLAENSLQGAGMGGDAM